MRSKLIDYLGIVETKETIHAALKVQVVGVLFRYGDDQLPVMRRNSLTSLYSSHRWWIPDGSSPEGCTTPNHLLACLRVVSMRCKGRQVGNEAAYQ